PRLQAIGLRIPAVKATHNRYAARIGGPDAEHRSGLAIAGREMRSHSVVDTVVATFVEEIEVLIGENPRLGDTCFRAHGWRRLVMRISLQKRTAGWYGYVGNASIAVARVMTGAQNRRARLTGSRHAQPASHTSLASAPAVLQGPGNRRVPASVGAFACAKRLLRHGEV